MRQLFRELKRRNVYRVAVTYAAVAFVTLQAARLIFPATTLEGLYDKLVVLAFVGFPIALVLAWAFEVTPEGVRRTTEAEEGEAGDSTGYQWIGLALIVLLAGGVWYATAGDGGEPTPETASATDTAQTTEASPDRSASRDRPFVAVLPLENLSPKEENQFFADGIHEEILSQLSTLSGLGVFGRTTMRQYADTEKSLYEIGRELDAQAVLEGSVRRAAGRVRISAQLIDPESRDHLWSQTYERELSPEAVFDIQAEVAGQIAGALKTRLAEEERVRIEEAPTDDLAAYDAYLKGRSLIWEFFAEDRAPLLDSAVVHLRAATNRDSTFAQAEGFLGWAYGIRYAVSGDRRWMDSAFVAARRAEGTKGDVAAAGIARAYTYARADSTEKALEELRRVLELRPSHEIATIGMFDVLEDRRELGRAIPWALRAVRQNPHQPTRLVLLVNALRRLNLLQAAAAWCDRALEYSPRNGSLVGQCAKVRFERGDRSGAISRLRAFLDKHPGKADALFAIGALLIRAEEYAEGVEFLELGSAARDEAYPADSPTTPEDAGSPAYYRALAAYARLRLGEREAARSALESIARDLRSRLEPAGVNYADRLALLAGVHAALGDETESRNYLERSVAEGRADELESSLFDPVRETAWFERLSRTVSGRIEAERDRLRGTDLYPPGAEPDTPSRGSQADD